MDQWPHTHKHASAVRSGLPHALMIMLENRVDQAEIQRHPLSSFSPLLAAFSSSIAAEVSAPFVPHTDFSLTSGSGHKEGRELILSTMLFKV